MPPLETLPPLPRRSERGEYFTSGLFCLQREHLAHEYFLTVVFLRGGVVSASPNPQAGGPPLVGFPRLLIQFIRSYPPYQRPFLHPQPEDAPWRGDRDPQTQMNGIRWWIDLCVLFTHALLSAAPVVSYYSYIICWNNTVDHFLIICRDFV